MIPFELSKNLAHTWFIDLDGTILKHNGHLNGKDELLSGVSELWKKIPDNDIIVITSARSKEYEFSTLKFLRESGIRFDHHIFGLPQGERIIINDIKDGGLKTAISWNVERNKGYK